MLSKPHPDMPLDIFILCLHVCIEGVMLIGMGQVVQNSYVIGTVPYVRMEALASSIQTTPPSISVPVHPISWGKIVSFKLRLVSHNWDPLPKLILRLCSPPKPKILYETL